MSNKEDLKKKILEEKDYIKCPRSFNSLEKYLAKSPEVVENKTIARLLIISEEEVEILYQEAVDMIRKGVGEENAD